MTKRYLVLLMWLAAGLSSPALAQPVGPEFQVNTYTPYAQSSPSVASDPSGNFVVVWNSEMQDGDGWGVFGQRYDSGGIRRGGEFQVNRFTAKAQSNPSVASDPAGNFVVVWESNSNYEEGRSFGLFGQRYDSAGHRLGSEFRVDTNTQAYPELPDVASDASGNFVVVWQTKYGAENIFGQRYDSDGNRQGSEFQVNTYTTSRQDHPSVASDASGDFVVVWEGGGSQDGDSWGVFGQRYDSSGNAIGGEFQVNTYTTNSQARPSVSSDASGNFVVVWESYGSQDGDIWGIFAQRYDIDGNPLGGEFQVNTYTSASQIGPEVASGPDGNLVVTWEGNDQDGDDWGVFGQQFDSAGERIGGEFQVNTYTTGNQRDASVAWETSGNFIVTWESSHPQDGSNYGIFGQRFGEETDPLRCGDLRAARARCHNSDLELGIALRDGSHDGDTLTVRINGQDQVITISGNRAQTSSPDQGLNTLQLVNPPNCGPEKTVQCP